MTLKYGLGFMLFVFLGVVIAAGFYLHMRTQRGVQHINEQATPIGNFAIVDDLDVHYVDIPARGEALATVVFLHGASGNLRDQHVVFNGVMPKHVRQIYIDRPGHGWSERDNRDLATPTAQAHHIVNVLDRLGVDQAILVGHSWSGALSLAIALEYPDRVQGLVLNSPVSHPWPGGINWYYNVAAIPIIGRIFAQTLALPVGLGKVDCATEKVFWPEPVPDYYDKAVTPQMVLDPARFLPNAKDIAYLRPQVVNLSKRYGEIKVPVHIITGAKDQVVLPWVHTDGLKRDIAHAEVTLLPNAGHMPHHGNPSVFVDAIMEIANKQAGNSAMLAAE